VLLLLLSGSLGKGFGSSSGGLLSLTDAPRILSRVAADGASKTKAIVSHVITGSCMACT
jgi:hypothetical protein